MERTLFRTHVDTALEIDICWPCHVIWFDNLESVSMSAQSVIDLFQQINDRRDAPRQIVSMAGKCPICRESLLQSFDFSKTGRFQYQRCPNGHGRLITFVQFLREKQFVRTLSQVELAKLSVTVKQVRCSSCGAGIDIEHDAACTHCGAPISVLDDGAVAKALAELDAKRARRLPTDATAYVPLPYPSIESDRPSPFRLSPTEGVAAGHLLDLVVTGVAAIISATLD
jgi:hypothetical protein